MDMEFQYFNLKHQGTGAIKRVERCSDVEDGMWVVVSHGYGISSRMRYILKRIGLDRDVSNSED